MASSTSPGLRLELIADGEKANTWGTITNNNLSILDRAVSGYHVVAFDETNEILTGSDYVLADWHNMSIKCTGALTQNSNLIVPAFEKMYVVENATTGDFAFTVKTGGGTGVTIERGQKAICLCDGVNVVGVVLQPFSTGLNSISGVVTGGALYRKTDGTYVSRTLIGTDEQITVTNGNGNDGAPQLSLSANALFPGIVRTTGRLEVGTGGLTVFQGGATIGGAVRLAGPNETLTVAASSGFGGIELVGPSGATIDLKNSEAEDFDFRLLSESNNGWAISNNLLNLQSTNNASAVQFIIGSAVKGFVHATGLTVNGSVTSILSTNADAPIISQNTQRTWNMGVRAGAGGSWSLRNNNSDAIVVDGPTNKLFVNGGLTVSAGNVEIPNGGLTCNGAVNFSAATTFQSKGILDVAPSATLTIGANKFVGINNPGPGNMLQLGSTVQTLSPVIGFETGGPAGFRSWTMGENYADFNFFITDATAGARRLTIEAATGRTSINGGLSVTNGTTAMDGRLTVNAGGASIAGGTTLTKAGGGTSVTISNPSNSGGDGAQVLYNGQSFNVFTRVSQATGAFEFVNTAYSAVMASITQAGQIFNATGTYGTLSDIRLKEHVATSASFLDRLKQLRVVDYSLRSAEREAADQVGFIAQEVEQVFPELVIDCGDLEDISNVKVVATSNIVPMLVSVIQELTARIEALEADRAE